MFWNFFVMMDRVVDLVTDQQVVVIIVEGVGRLFPFISRRRCLVSGGTKHK